MIKTEYVIKKFTIKINNLLVNKSKIINLLIQILKFIIGYYIYYY